MKKITKLLTAFILSGCIAFLTPCSLTYAMPASDTAEELYSKINAFLDETKDVPSNEIQEACIKYMKSRMGKPTVLEESEFKSQLSGKAPLWRGVLKKKYSNDLKKGNIFLATNDKGLNDCGNGIYCTSCITLARAFNYNIFKMQDIFVEEIKTAYPYSFKDSNTILRLLSTNPGIFNLTKSEKYSKFVDAYKQRQEDFSNELRKEDPDENKLFELCPDKGVIMQMFLDDNAKIININDLKQIISQIKEKHHRHDSKYKQIIDNYGFLALLLGYDAVYHYPCLDEYNEYVVVNARVLTISNEDI